MKGDIKMESFMGFISNLVDKLPEFLKPWGEEFLLRYFDVQGRTDRATFWKTILVNFIMSFVIGLFGAIPVLGWIITTVYSLAVIVPGVTLIIRRLNDIGKSWPWIFISFVPCVGSLILIVFCCLDSAA